MSDLDFRHVDPTWENYHFPGTSASKAEPVLPEVELEGDALGSMAGMYFPERLIPTDEIVDLDADEYPDDDELDQLRSLDPDLARNVGRARMLGEVEL